VASFWAENTAKIGPKPSGKGEDKAFENRIAKEWE
jgi:hypothetical protein